MQTFDSVIEQMIRNGVVSKETAMSYASNANNLLLRISDMSATPPPKPQPAKEEGSILDMIER